MFTWVSILLLLVIFMQDFRKRAVLWLLFPVLFACNLWINPFGIGITEMLWSATFIFTLLVALTLYLRGREGRWVWVWEGFFSLGDILFLVAIIPLFTPFSFVCFFTVGTFVTILLHVLISPFSENKSIPYAGYLALVTVPYLLIPQTIQHLINQLSV